MSRNRKEITPYNPSIEEHESGISLYDGMISEPSKNAVIFLDIKGGIGQLGRNT